MCTCTCISFLIVIHFILGRNLIIVTEEGEVFSSVAMSGQPLSLARLASVQNARAVFTDFKAINFAYIQNVYRSEDDYTYSTCTMYMHMYMYITDSILKSYQW